MKSLNRYFFITNILGLFIFFSCSKDDNTSEETTTVNKIGLFNEVLWHNNVTREYILYVPASYDGTSKLPVMFNFHGYGITANNYMNSITDMRSLADMENFILVYPQGTLIDGLPYWNAGLETEENKSSADDFGFVEEMINKISTDYNVDLERIYACGYSNGSFFSYALACFHSDKIAAIGSVSGTMLEETFKECNPSHPTAMINFHGTSDFFVPYAYDNGQDSEGLLAIDTVINYWINFNNTNTTPIINTYDDNGTMIEHYAYTNGDNNVAVEHYKIIGGKHDWFDNNFNGSNTNRLIWDFVSQYDINGLR